MLGLAIETSCDETSAAVLRTPDGGTRPSKLGTAQEGGTSVTSPQGEAPEILSNIVLSQDEVHAPYGGVVPELASRQHIRSITAIVGEALSRAGAGTGSVSLSPVRPKD